MRVLLRLFLWNLGFIACIGAIAIYADRAISDPVGISLPYITGVWLLVLGARFANRTASVIAIAIIASLFFLFQSAILGFVIMMSADHFERRNLSQLLLAGVVVTGVVFIWWFISAKLSQTKAKA